MMQVCIIWKQNFSSQVQGMAFVLYNRIEVKLENNIMFHVVIIVYIG